MRARACPIVVVALVVIGMAAPAAAQIGDRAIEVLYVPNRESDTISIVDIDPGSATRYEVIGTIDLPKGVKPTAVVTTSDGKKAFVVASFDGVYPINPRNLGKPVGKLIKTGNSPLAAEMAPDDSVLFVTNLLSDTLSVIDTHSNKVINSFSFDNGLGFASFPLGLAVLGNELWASAQFPGRIERFTADGALNHLGTIPFPGTVPFFPPINSLPLFPVDIAFSDDGSEAYAPTFQSPDFGVPDGFAVIGVSAGACMVGGEVPPCVTQQVDSNSDADIGPGSAEVEVPNLLNNPAGLVWVTNFGKVDENFFPSGSPLTTEITIINPANVNNGGNTTLVATGGESPGGIALSRPNDEVFIVNVFAGAGINGSVSVFDAGDPFGGLKNLGGKANPIVGGTLGHTIGVYPVTPVALRIPVFPDAVGPVFDPAVPCGTTITQAIDDLSNINFDVIASVPLDDFFDNVSLVMTDLPTKATVKPRLDVPLTGPVTVTSNFDWTPRKRQLGTHEPIFTASDEFGRSTTCTVTIDIVERPDPGDFIPFAEFTPEVEIDKKKDTYEVKGTFTLGPFSNDIDPLTEDVLFKLNDYEITIPAGSFEKDGSKKFEFEGTIDGQEIEMKLEKKGGDQWKFEIEAEGAPVDTITNPIDVVLEFKDDGGKATVTGEIKGDEDDANTLKPRVKIDQKKNSYKVTGYLQLGDGSDGLEPENEKVVLKLDDYTLTIPSGSFERQGSSNNFKFNGKIGGEEIKAELKEKKNGKWQIKFDGKKVPAVDDIENPITVVLEVGNDSAQATVNGSIKKDKKGGDDDDDDDDIVVGGSSGGTSSR